MPITKLLAKDFATREDLEHKVRVTTGLDPGEKPDYEIRGTRDELNRLNLSDRTTFYGIHCVITDDPTPIKAQKDQEKPERGNQTKFGINGQLK